MTDDIVTRLRDWRTTWTWDTPDEAADEIERLREQLREASRMSDHWYQQYAR